MNGAWTGAALDLLAGALLLLLPAVWVDSGDSDLGGLVIGLLACALVGAVTALVA